MVLWSVIVFGKTKYADFRFLSIPEDFELEDEQWADEHIKVTTRFPKKLKGNPRWSLFKNDKHCVIGVACMVEELIGNDEKYRGMTEDASGRPLYIFVGYAAKVDGDLKLFDIPKYSGHLAIFRYPFECVQHLWEMKDYQVITQGRQKSEYDTSLTDYGATEPIDFITWGNGTTLLTIQEEVFSKRGLSRYSSSFLNLHIFYHDFPINLKDDEAYLWKDSEESRNKLWENAVHVVVWYPSKSISLCLGLPLKNNQLVEAFLNATTSSIMEFHEVIKKMPNHQQKLSEEEGFQATSSNNTSNQTNLRLIIFITVGLVLLLTTLVLPLSITINIISALIGFLFGLVAEYYSNAQTSNTKRKTSKFLENIKKIIKNRINFF